MSAIVILTSNAEHMAAITGQIPAGMDVRPAVNLKELSDGLLWEDTEFVVLDVDTPGVDALEAVRLIKGTRWDVDLRCIGTGEGAERAARAGATVAPPTAWLNQQFDA